MVDWASETQMYVFSYGLLMPSLPCLRHPPRRRRRRRWQQACGPAQNAAPQSAPPARSSSRRAPRDDPSPRSCAADEGTAAGISSRPLSGCALQNPCGPRANETEFNYAPPSAGCERLCCKEEWGVGWGIGLKAQGWAVGARRGAGIGHNPPGWVEIGQPASGRESPQHLRAVAAGHFELLPTGM